MYMSISQNRVTNFERQTIFEGEIKLEEACEPQNIIWEKKHIRESTIRIRLLVAIAVIIFLLSFYFGLIIKMKKKVINLEH